MPDLETNEMDVPKMRLMIVEDDTLIAMDLAAMLEDMGHVVVAEVDDGNEAVAVAGEMKPDMVLMDVQLANGTNGLVAAREIFKRYGIRSLFVSGNVDETLRKHAQELTPVGFLHKPVTPYDLARMLASLPKKSGQGVTR